MEQGQVDGRRARKGVKKGPRKTFFVCVTITKDGQPIVDRVAAPSPEAAGEAFQTSHRKKATKIEGPFYEVRGAQAATARGPALVIPAKEINFTGKRFEGILSGWRVIGQGLVAGPTLAKQGFKDDDYVFLMPPTEPVDPEAKARKPRLGTKPYVLRSEIENVKSI